MNKLLAKYFQINIKNNNFFFFYFLFFFLSYLCLTNSIIEIPFKTMPVKNIPKYKDIAISAPDYSQDLDLKMLNSEGNTNINSNYLFLTEIKVGSDEQTFNLLLDTGSYLLWVAKQGSIDTGTPKISRHFNPSSSTTIKNTYETFRITYGTGSCNGAYYYDNLKYINEKIYMKFGVAEKTDFGVDNCDGIIGLGHDYSNIEDLSLIHMLKKYEITDSLKFSFKFTDLNNGKLVLGEHKDFSSSKVHTCPLIIYKNLQKNIFWTCQVSGFGLKNSKTEITSSKSYDIIFDTGTNYIMLPLEYYNDIKDKLIDFGCETTYYSSQDHDLQLKCSNKNSLPEIRFTINGAILTMSQGLSFSRKRDSFYYSQFLFVENRFIIGSPFFLAFHTLFDKEKEMLLFYPEELNNIENEINVISIIALVVVVILLMLALGYLIYQCILWKKSKRQLQDLNNNNYNYNFL